MLVGKKNIIACLFLFLLTAALVPACAQQISLGSVSFPTTGKPEAQAHFLRGLAALLTPREALPESWAAALAANRVSIVVYGAALAALLALGAFPQWLLPTVARAAFVFAHIGP